MKRIILVRHGESAGNVRQVGGTVEESYINDAEILLTENGLSQAYNTGKTIYDYLVKNRTENDIEMWCSPFARTRQTAKEINKTLMLEEIFEDPRLIEQDFGDFDFQFFDNWKIMSPHSWFINQKRYNSRASRFFARIENGESLSDVYNRVSIFDLSRCINNPKDQILVTHGCFIRAALIYFTGAKIEFAYDFDEIITNCKVFVLSKEEKDSVYQMSSI